MNEDQERVKALKLKPIKGRHFRLRCRKCGFSAVVTQEQRRDLRWRVYRPRFCPYCGAGRLRGEVVEWFPGVSPTAKLIADNLAEVQKGGGDAD